MINVLSIAPVVVSAIAAGASMFLFVLLFFRFSRQGLSGMQRLYLSWWCGGLVWLVCLAHQLPRRISHDTRLDLACGALVMCCFVWSTYWFANLGGGFRILMLLDLADLAKPVSLEEWMQRYGQQRGMKEFLDDRMRSILVPAQLVRVDGERVTLTRGRGRLLASLLRVLSVALLKRS